MTKNYLEIGTNYELYEDVDPTWIALWVRTKPEYSRYWARRVGEDGTKEEIIAELNLKLGRLQ